MTHSKSTAVVDQNSHNNAGPETCNATVVDSCILEIVQRSCKVSRKTTCWIHCIINGASLPPWALSLASPGVPGNCRKQCSVPGKLPGSTMVFLRWADGNIKRACVVRYFRQKHDGRNHYETNDLCKSCNYMIVSFAHFILIIKHVL